LTVPCLITSKILIAPMWWYGNSKHTLNYTFTNLKENPNKIRKFGPRPRQSTSILPLKIKLPLQGVHSTLKSTGLDILAIGC